MTDEEAEFRDVLVSSLGSKGVLNKCKAQIRANVILALEQQEGEEGGGSTLQQPRVAEYLRTGEGAIMLSLIREFLQFHDLEYSLSVFEPESSIEGVSHTREQLAQEMGLRASLGDRPLLHHLVFNRAPLVGNTAQQLTPPQDAVNNNKNNNNNNSHNNNNNRGVVRNLSPTPSREYSEPTGSVSAAVEAVSDYDITNENSDILAPADDVSDRNSQSDLDDFFSGLGGAGFSQHLLNVKDLVPQTKDSSTQERPRSARGSGRSAPALSSLQGAPPLSGAPASLEMELKSVLREPSPTRGTRRPHVPLSHSQQSSSDSIDELKLTAALDSTLLSHSNETTDHTTSAVSLGDLDYVEDVLRK